MSSARKPVITQEPLPGWLRLEVEGEKPLFKTPVPRTVIRDASKLREFLDKEHSNGRMLEIDGSEFSFKRRLGLRKQKTPKNSTVMDVVEEYVPSNGAERVIVVEEGEMKKRLQVLSRG